MDQSLLLSINQAWINPFLDWVMVIASSMDFWMPILVLGGIVWFLLGGFRARAMFLATALSILMVDGIIVNNTKKWIGRPRPGDVLTDIRQLDLVRVKPRILAVSQPLKINYSTPKKIAKTGRSLPSGHTANNFAFATVLTIFYRRWGWLYFIPASIVAYSRVYVGSHWPSDVLISALLGVVVTILVVKAADWLWARYVGRLYPKFHEKHPRLIPA